MSINQGDTFLNFAYTFQFCTRTTLCHYQSILLKNKIIHSSLTLERLTLFYVLLHKIQLCNATKAALKGMLCKIKTSPHSTFELNRFLNSTIQTTTNNTENRINKVPKKIPDKKNCTSRMS